MWRLRLSPPVTAIRNLRAAVWRVLQPYYAAAAARIDRVNFDYHEFLSEETKRKWEWKRRTEQERSFWDAATSFVLGALFCRDRLSDKSVRTLKQSRGLLMSHSSSI